MKADFNIVSRGHTENPFDKFVLFSLRLIRPQMLFHFYVS